MKIHRKLILHFMSHKWRLRKGYKIKVFLKELLRRIFGHREEGK